MQRAVLLLAIAGALTSLSPGAAAAPAATTSPVVEEATYRAAFDDLFPGRDDLDVGVEVVAAVQWRLPAGVLAPGAALARDLAPTPGPLEVRVQYRVQRACCAEQSVQGMRVLRDEAPLGELELEPLEVDTGRVLVLRLAGALRAAMVADGPGRVEPGTAAWDHWAPQPLDVAAEPDAPAGSEVAVRARTVYAMDLQVMMDDAAAERRAEAPADLLLVRSFAVEPAGPGGAGARLVPAPGPLLVVPALGLAVAVARACRRG